MAKKMRTFQAVIPNVVIAATPALVFNPCMAQCSPQWSAYSGPQLDNGVFAVTTWDPDGTGPALPVVVAGGNFEHAGQQPVSHVGQWSGSAWLPMGQGVMGTVLSATTWQNGTGVLEPVVGGYFILSGPTMVNRIARFSGTDWLPLGVGVGSTGATVLSMTEFQSSLIVGGTFSTAGGILAGGLARWDGAAWHAFPDERASWADTLGTHAGSLYAGGWWPVPNGGTVHTGILRWQDPTWVVVGENFPQDDVNAITTYQGQLIAGGDFTNQCCGNPPAPGEFIARFDGAAWLPLGNGLDGPVQALCVFDPDGPGPIPELLIAGGSFSGGLAAWNGTDWSPLGSTSGPVRALTIWNNQLVVAGEFFFAGGLASPGMAFWGCPQPATCYPNCDASTTPPVLNINDFVCFLDAFVAGSPYANCDQSTRPPTLNILDFVCFLNRFATGCS